LLFANTAAAAFYSLGDRKSRQTAG
jgi:hypothetical protein